MEVRAFIENTADSSMNHKYCETTGEYLGSTNLYRPYPHHYGFLPGTLGEDGDCVDCFVLSDKPLERGQTHSCELIGLLEMWENAERDHKVILGNSYDQNLLGEDIDQIRDFELHVFGAQPGVMVEVGALLGKDEARRYIEAQTLGTG